MIKKFLYNLYNKIPHDTFIARMGMILMAVSFIALLALFLNYSYQMTEYGFFIKSYHFDIALRYSKCAFGLGVVLTWGGRYISKLINWIKTGHI